MTYRRIVLQMYRPADEHYRAPRRRGLSHSQSPNRIITSHPSCTNPRGSVYQTEHQGTPKHDLSIEVDRRIRNAWCRFRKYTLELYDRPSVPREFQIRMLRAEVLETMLYGRITSSLRACQHDALHRVRHRLLSRCISWRKHNRADHPTSYTDMLIKTGSESIEATLCRCRILFAEFLARM